MFAFLRNVPIRLFSPLDVATCLRRLDAKVDPPRDGFVVWPEPGKPFVGSIQGDKVTLQRPAVSNKRHWLPVFTGRLIAQSGGTVIEGNLESHALVRGFLWLFGVLYATLAVGVGGYVIAGIATATELAAPWFVFVLPFCFVGAVFGVNLLLMSYWFNSSHRLLLTFLRDELHAEEIADATQVSTPTAD